MPTLYEICQPREDVLRGTIQESDFAADLAQVLRGDAPREYLDPELFFGNTYPTRGLKDLLRNVASRLSGRPEQVGSLFRIDTQYGGGKTHSLIALVHAMRGQGTAPYLAEFLDPALLPGGGVRVAAYDGENADPANGRRMSDAVRAYTPWGELAYQLGGEAGYQRIEKSDREGIAPGADTLRELLGDGACLVLLDELPVYLRKVGAASSGRAAGQLTAFLTALFKAVESTPRAALVFTLALGKDGRAGDAYSRDTQDVAAFIAEAESVSARKASLLDPTEEDETVRVLCRRLFARIDAGAAQKVVMEYAAAWEAHKALLPRPAAEDRRVEEFLAGYPLHPELIATLTNKTATLGTFQRVRGMLRLLARAVALLWQQRPPEARALHLHHLDPGHEPIRQEIVTRLQQRQLVPAIRAEVAAHAGEQPSLAQDLDARFYGGIAPFGSWTARCILWHTLAYNDALRGLGPDELRYSILAPGIDPSFIDDARKRLIEDSAYLDDRPHAPLRFLSEANLTQMIRREEMRADPGELRAQLNDRVRAIFGGSSLNLVPFAAGPHDVADDPGEEKPALVLVSYDAASVPADEVSVPPLVAHIFAHRGSSGDWRHNRNCLAFVVADAQSVEHMKSRMARRMALEALRVPDRIRELADYQQAKLREQYERSSQELALAIQQTYRHVFYPSRNRLEGAEVDLAHTVVDVQTASDRPGDGQRQVVLQLQNVGKLRLATDAPDSPIYVRDRTPLKKGSITTAQLRREFRTDVALPMLVGDEVFLRGVRNGIDMGEYVYQSGDLVFGKDDPAAQIKIDEQSFLYTAAYARERNIWPRPQAQTAGIAPAAGATIYPPHPSAVAGASAPETQLPAADGALRFVVEDALKAAFSRALEQAAAAGAVKINRLRLRAFDAQDALRLIAAVKGIANAERRIELEAGFESEDGSVTRVDFKGSVAEAEPLKEFLEAQLRAAKEKDLTCSYFVEFTPPFALAGGAADRLVERLARVAPGSAEVVLEVLK